MTVLILARAATARLAYFILMVVGCLIIKLERCLACMIIPQRLLVSTAESLEERFMLLIAFVAIAGRVELLLVDWISWKLTHIVHEGLKIEKSNPR